MRARGDACSECGKDDAGGKIGRTVRGSKTIRRNDIESRGKFIEGEGERGGDKKSVVEI